MIDDPIVEEVYRARQKIMDECHGDVKKWIARLKAAESSHAGRIITVEAIQAKRGREGRSREAKREPKER